MNVPRLRALSWGEPGMHAVTAGEVGNDAANQSLEDIVRFRTCLSSMKEVPYHGTKNHDRPPQLHVDPEPRHQAPVKRQERKLDGKG